MRVRLRNRIKGKTVWRIVEATVALFSLLVAYQLIWLLFNSYFSLSIFPNHAVWVIPTGHEQKLYDALKLQSQNPQNQSPPPIEVDSLSVDLKGFAPSKAEVKLRINDIDISAPPDRSGSFGLGYVELKRGYNYITAELVNEPLGPGERQFRIQLLCRPNRLQPIFLGWNPTGTRGARAFGLAEPSSEIVIGNSKNNFSRVTTDEVGVFEHYFTLSPNEGVRLTVANSEQGIYAPPDAVLEVPAAPEAAPSDQSPAELQPKLKRKILLFVRPDREYRLKLQVEAVAGTAMAEWIDNPRINLLQLLTRVFGAWFTVGPPESIVVHNRKESATGLHSAVEIEATGRLYDHESEFVFAPTGMLPILSLPQDEVRLEAPDPSLQPVVAPPDQLDGSVLIWRGPRSAGFRDPLVKLKVAPVAAEVVQEGEQPPQQQESENFDDLIHQLQRAQGKIPEQVQWILWALLTAVPFLWLLRILKKPMDPSSPAREKDGYKTTLGAVTVTFLIFHLTILSLRVFSFGLESLHDRLSAIVAKDPKSKDYVVAGLAMLKDVGDFYPFLAIGITVLLLPIFYAYKRRLVAPSLGRRIFSQLLRWFTFWPMALLIPVGLFIGLVYFKVTGLTQGEALLIAFVFLVAGLLLLWFFLYWLIRIGLGRSVSLPSVIRTSCAMLLFPLLPPLLDYAGGYARYLIVSETNINPFIIPRHLDYVLWLLIIVGMGTLLLFRVTYLSVRLSNSRRSLRMYYAPSTRLLLLVVFLLLCIPTSYLLRTSKYVVPSVENLTALAFRIDTLLPYALLMGLLVFLKRLNPKDEFDLPKDAVRVGMLIFAFYVTGRTSNILFIPIPLLLGWYIFSRWMLVPQKTAELDETSASPPGSVSLNEIVKRLLDYNRAVRLSHDLPRSLEKKYTGGDLTLAKFIEQIEESNRYLNVTTSALPAEPARTKHLIFGRGPESGPWMNAKVAVKYGFFLSILFQLGDLTEFIRGGSIGEYPIIRFAEYLLFSASSWLLIAFVFGYFFHYIRGRDGFEKSLVYSAAILISTIPLRIIKAQPVLGQGHLIEMMQVFAYVIVLALLAFDLRKLQNLGYTWRDLLSVHGFTTITGYASSIAISMVASIAGKDVLPPLWGFLKQNFFK